MKKESKTKSLKEMERLFIEANAAWDRGDLRQAFSIFCACAKQGDSASQLDLGYFFDNGLFVKKDRRLALKWYHRAYLQGVPGAANNIATVYREMGETRKMWWWFRRAAAMGDTDVLLDLGKRYELGLDLPKNLEMAEKYYHLVFSSEYAIPDDKVKAGKSLARLARQKGVG